MSAALVNYEYSLSESYQGFLRITALINIGEIYTFYELVLFWLKLSCVNNSTLLITVQPKAFWKLCVNAYTIKYVFMVNLHSCKGFD